MILLLPNWEYSRGKLQSLKYGIVNRQHRPAGVTEYVFNTLIFEGFQDDFRPGQSVTHLFHSLRPCSHPSISTCLYANFTKKFQQKRPRRGLDARYGSRDLFSDHTLARHITITRIFILNNLLLFSARTIGRG